MTFHAAIEYLKYRLKAQNRHGVHSPFAYELNEQVLNKTGSDALPEKLKNYYTAYSILFFERLEDWPESLPAGSRSIVLLKNVHTDKLHTAKWERLCSTAGVKMSIDLYKYGMLLSLDDFKEKQHFTLRYSGR